MLICQMINFVGLNILMIALNNILYSLSSYGFHRSQGFESYYENLPLKGSIYQWNGRKVMDHSNCAFIMIQM